MSTAWPSPERLPAAVERSGAPSSTLGCTTDDVVKVIHIPRSCHSLKALLADETTVLPSPACALWSCGDMLNHDGMRIEISLNSCSECSVINSVRDRQRVKSPV